MSDNGEVEVENSSYPVLPKDVTDEIGTIKLFNKWSYEDVEIRDISLTCGILFSFIPFTSRAHINVELQRLHTNPNPRLHLPFRRSLRLETLPQGPVPYHRAT